MFSSLGKLLLQKGIPYLHLEQQPSAVQAAQERLRIICCLQELHTLPYLQLIMLCCGELIYHIMSYHIISYPYKVLLSTGGIPSLI